jgi:hypothetical protein
MKFRFHAHYTEYLSLEVEAESLEDAREIAEKSCGGNWERDFSGDWVIDHDLTINLTEKAASLVNKLKQSDWLIDFKAEFLRRTGITWEDAGSDDQDALDRYYPQDVSESVSLYIEKYDLNDITL